MVGGMGVRTNAHGVGLGRAISFLQIYGGASVAGEYFEVDRGGEVLG